jgi:nucleoside-diphosphate-sugar epimerase
VRRGRSSAAATGKASAGRTRSINAQGTETLLAECREAGVAVFCSSVSIAAAFPPGIGYHYADASGRPKRR